MKLCEFAAEEEKVIRAEQREMRRLAYLRLKNCLVPGKVTKAEKQAMTRNGEGDG